MDSIFVWTIKDVVGIGVFVIGMVILGIYVLVMVIKDKIEKYRTRRGKK